MDCRSDHSCIVPRRPRPWDVMDLKDSLKAVLPNDQGEVYVLGYGQLSRVTLTDAGVDITSVREVSPEECVPWKPIFEMRIDGLTIIISPIKIWTAGTVEKVLLQGGMTSGPNS